MKTEQFYKATFDHAVSGISWKSGDGEYKEMFPTPIHLMSGDYLELTLDPAPANGEYFVHVVVGDKNETKGIKGIVAPKLWKPTGTKLYPNQLHWGDELKDHWAEDYAVPRPALKRGIDKFDYLLEEAK